LARPSDFLNCGLRIAERESRSRNVTDVLTTPEDFTFRIPQLSTHFDNSPVSLDLETYAPIVESRY
jgi:hypothetical protein